MDLESLGIGSIELISDAAKRACIGDARLTRRNVALVEALAANPDATPAEVLGSEAAVEAYYRFVRNRRTEPTKLVAPHVEATLKRLESLEAALAIYDQTPVQHGNGRGGEGFYPLTKGRYGYMAHVGLAVAVGAPCPLGLLGLEPVARDPAIQGKAERRKKLRVTPHAERESAIWARMALQTAELAGPSARLIHVMDREADTFGTLDALVRANQDFVIRLNHDRTSDQGKLKALSETAEVLLEREVYLSARTGKKAPGAQKKHPSRKARPARLAVRSVTAKVHRPRTDFDKAWSPKLTMNLVRVTEQNPPKGEKPVDWLLVTTLPIATAEDVGFVVDCYRARWLIEEYFAALKVGCDFNDRLYQSLNTSATALALAAPVAVHLLQMRFLARHHADLPARKVMPPHRLLVLHEHEDAPELPIDPTVSQVYMAIARLGGHLKSNGEPGWKVLGRGYAALLTYERGFMAALRMMKRAGVPGAGT